MAAKKRAAQKKNATPVESYIHDDKRVNIPTADSAELVTPEVEEISTLRYPRNPDLDPQLVWKGKDEQDGEDLVVDVPPIYVQEKIDPRVLVENLRDTADKPEHEPEWTLFESFDGIDGLKAVEYYQHESNWANRMILGDSLQTMASLAERESLRGKVQMIYMDPPYGIKFGSNWQVSLRDRAVKDTQRFLAREAEVVKAFRDTWELGTSSYLTYLRDRLQVARDLLTDTGSVFVQIGDENVHRVRSVLDEVFGDSNFVSQISFKTKMALGASLLPNVYDHILWYGKSKQNLKFRHLFAEKSAGEDSLFDRVQTVEGDRRKATNADYDDSGELVEDLMPYRHIDMTSAGLTESCVFPVEIDGKTINPKSGKSWKTNHEGMSRLKIAGRLARQGNGLAYVYFHQDFPRQALLNVWTDTRAANERMYVVQTSTRIVERCMLMCTDPGDLVLDPTCGSGTTAVVAEQFGRRWITIDSSRVALAIAKQRMLSTKFPYYLLADSDEGREKEFGLSGHVAPPTPATGDIRQGFVYQRVPHITLGSIAQNPDIKEGMSKKEIDAVIAKNAEFENLFDKPFENNKKIRVAGRFTVESLSPHRALGLPTTLDDQDDVSAESGEDFNGMILENLSRAGIQNGLKAERLSFDSLDSYPGDYVQAIGSREESVSSKIAISIGPQYGTVSASFIQKATKEAQKIEGVSVLCVLGFAFDPNVLNIPETDITDDAVAAVQREVKMGKVTVVLVRMNTDLLMGDELKKTGAGNLFLVAGEPDIDIRVNSEGVVVEICGVDVYDPNTEQVRSRSADEIALWMIDTNYNGESFFVRHCYFPGGYDWYAQLKRALKAEIDEEAWDSLNKTVSRTFPRPATGQIAVKVINDYGDEVMKVYDVQ